MEIKFGGLYDKEIYRKTIFWVYKPKPLALVIRAAIFVVFAVLYGMLVYQAFQDGEFASLVVTRIFRHFITLALFLYFLLAPYIAAYRKFSELWNDPLVRRNLRGSVSSRGVKFDFMSEWMAWDGFVKVNKDSSSIALLTAAQTFVLLQRSFFQTDHDWKALQNLVDMRVQEVIE